MPIFYPNEATLERAADMRTVLALSKVRLFKSPFNPTVLVTIAELEAEEADFTGYTPGGIAITNFTNPLLDPAGGSSIESGTVQFEWATGSPDVTNLIGGFWLEKATGELYVVGKFPEAIPMETVGQGIPLNIKLVEPTGQGV